MNPIIYCTNTKKGKHDFYVKANGETHFLFRQDYRKGVDRFFSRGRTIDHAIDFTRAKEDSSLLHTMEKFNAYIRYIEREYDLAILRKTIRRNSQQKKKAA